MEGSFPRNYAAPKGSFILSDPVIVGIDEVRAFARAVDNANAGGSPSPVTLPGKVDVERFRAAPHSLLQFAESLPLFFLLTIFSSSASPGLE